MDTDIVKRSDVSFLQVVCHRLCDEYFYVTQLTVTY